MNCYNCLSHIERKTEVCTKCNKPNKFYINPKKSRNEKDHSEYAIPGKEIKYCKYCGKKVQVNHIYCTKCGEKIDIPLLPPIGINAKQEKYLKGGPLGFLVFPIFYSVSMKLQTRFIIAIIFVTTGLLLAMMFGDINSISAVLLFYVLLIGTYSTSVRKTAYFGKRKWDTYENYAKVQKDWDDVGYGLLGVIIFAIVFIVLITIELRGN